MWWLLPCYFLIRPLCTLLPELCRALLMLSWSSDQSVDVHLGSLGHDRGLSLRLGRLNFRVHPYFFLLRGSISDTLAQPTMRQYLIWNASSLLCSAAILGACTVLVLGREVPEMSLPLLGMGGLLALIDLGFGLFREGDPICMRCGLVHYGPGPAIQTVFRYRGAAIAMLRGVRHYLRDDYRAALTAYQQVWDAGYRSEELLEDMQYAQMALGDMAAADATFAALQERYAPSATQYAVAAYVCWCLDDEVRAFACTDAAIDLASAQPVARNYRAWLYLQIGNPQAALADLDIALQSSSEYACAFANRANAHMRLGELKSAEADIRQSLRHDPLDLEGLATAVEVLQAVGASTDAATAQQRLALLTPKSPRP